jgi:release factor glutamine methyltransferase
MKVAEWLQLAAEHLRSAGIESPELEAQLIAAAAFNVERINVLIGGSLQVPNSANVLLRRRLGGEPLPYLTRRKEFYGLKFEVGPGVLIPRPETETLVELALALEGNALKVLDLCCGSGILAISLKVNRPDWIVYAADISVEALHYARINAEKLGADVTIRQSDWFQAFDGELFDLIICNPPYVANTDSIDQSVARFEPHVALYAEENGLSSYGILANLAPLHLKPGGQLIVEIGAGREAEVRQRFENCGWKQVREKRDLLGHVRGIQFSLTR